jgi:phosphatidylglycerol:prolipoprotein diacylglycerol transferase
MHPELFTIPWINFTVPGYGASVVVAFLVGTWWMTHRAAKVKADPDICLSLSLISLVFGWFGGRAFYVIHYWKTQFAQQPMQMINLTAGGFEVYGGLIVAAACALIYLWIKGVSLRLYVDIAAPTVLFGMGVGRIGCYLVGCCWGAACPASLPWAVTFPAMSAPHRQQWQDRLVTLPAELIIIEPSGIGEPVPHQLLKLTAHEYEQIQTKYQKADSLLADAVAGGNHAKIVQATRVKMALEELFDHLHRFDTTPMRLRVLAEQPQFRSLPVHPAQLYSAIGPILLALLTNAYFYRRKRHGMVMVITVLLYGIERFIEETVRLDNPLDTFGLTVAQGISIGFIVFAAVWYLILQRMPLRSSRPAVKIKKQPTPPTAPVDVPANPAVG